MAPPTRLLAVVLVASLVPACGDDEGNPFDQFTFSRAPSEDALFFYVSGAWSEEPGAPRELFALSAAAGPERLTTCTERSHPCDFLAVAASSDPARVVAVRGAIGGDPAASALYFIDLDRSVETIIALARRVQAADWGVDDALVLYSSGEQEDLFTVQANGENDSPVTETSDFRERSPSLAPSLAAAAYEGLRETPGKSGIYYVVRDDTAVQFTEGGPGSEVLPGTPYVVGSDASPVFSPTGEFLAFRRLTGTGNGGLGTWDILVMPSSDPDAEPQRVAGGDELFRGAPDWGGDGRLLFVETDAAARESRVVAIAQDGSNRVVLHSEDAGFRMAAPRWLR